VAGDQGRRPQRLLLGFVVKFAEDGTFIGGETGDMNGHRHLITRATVTEPGGKDGHVHRFSFVEGLVSDD
jgi:hypothetical protein